MSTSKSIRPTTDKASTKQGLSPILSLIIETNFPRLGLNKDCITDNRKQAGTDCGKSSVNNGAEQTSKKFQKVKYEIDRQNFTIAKLSREMNMKSQRGFPSACLHGLKNQICSEKKKLHAMVKHAMKLQSTCADDQWGPISITSFDSSYCDKPKVPQTPSDISKISAFTNLDFCESLLSDNESLDQDRFELQEELLKKDQVLHDLEDKVGILQCQLINICHENESTSNQMTTSQSCYESDKSDVKLKMNSVMAKTEKLTRGYKHLESNLSELRLEINSVKNEKKIAFDLQQEISGSAPCSEIKSTDDCASSRLKPSPCISGDDQIAKKMKVLQCQYSNLQSEFCRKEKECKETTDRMKKCLANCNNDNERAENEALKHRADELVTEINDYKVFIAELQEQVDIYRNKFMKAQEKVEQQRFLLENLEMNNKEVEAQINCELAKIKEKFQEKLNELCPYPKKYEEARVELFDSIQKISELEADLKATMAALSKAKCELKTLKEKPDESIEKKYKKLQCEVELLKKKSCAINSTKECLEEKLTSMKMELEQLRKESSKIITTSKCCAEKNRRILHEHINSLEVDLAQCRASATMSLTEKEQTIKKMKNELASLCGHFNDCQGQIKQLKNQVTYLTNQRHNIHPEDLHKIDYCYPEC